MSVVDYFQKHQQALNYTATHIDFGVVTKLVDQIQHNRCHLFFTGVGKNGHVAAKSASTFCSIGWPAHYINPVDAMHGDMALIEPNDLVIAISKSGTTEELTRFLSHVSARSAHIVMIHSNAELTPTVVCDSVYVPIQTECDHNHIVPTASILVFTALLQSIACELASRSQLTVQDFVHNHPGGTIGQIDIAHTC